MIWSDAVWTSRRERRPPATAQARMTAWMVAALPVGGGVMTELASPGTLSRSLGQGVGPVLLVVSGALDPHGLPRDAEQAIAKLVQVKGIGRWSAEIYLLFAEGRPDVWPAGDLAVQAGLHKLLALPERPAEKETRRLAEAWRPHRGAAAIFTWHCYNNPAL